MLGEIEGYPGDSKRKELCCGDIVYYGLMGIKPEVGSLTK